LIFDKGAQMEKRQPVQQIVLGKLVVYMQKTETRSPTLTLYKNPFKMVKDLNVRPKNFETTTGNRENS
jgi:hypothetical protein